MKIKKIRKIAIVNAHWNNRGDEAALLAVISGIRKSLPDSKITILFKDGKSVEQFPDIDNIDYFPAKFNAKIWDIWFTVLTRGAISNNRSLQRTVKTLRNVDLIIYSPGGSVINKRFWWIKQMEYLTPFMCAKFYGIPMRISAPSMGPFDLTKKNTITKWLLKVPDVICVREEISRKYLEDIGVTQNVHVTIDSAFYDEVDIAENQKKLKEYVKLDEFLTSYNNVVGITITDFKWHVKYNKDKELSGRITKTFNQFILGLKEKGYGVVFIPQLFGNQNDYDYMNGFSGENTFIISDKMDTYFQQFIISKLYAVVGMRYHSNIFSAKMGTPFIAISYEEKMQGFIDLSKMNQYTLSLDELSIEELTQRFKLLEDNYSNIKKMLINSNSNLQQKASKTIQLIAHV